MKHLSDEELVEHYYGEIGERVRQHVESCAECASACAALRNDLAAIDPIDAPERDAGYGQRMWSRVASVLPPAPAKESPTRKFFLWRGLGYAAVCAVLVVAAFYGGRVWEHRQQPAPVAHANPAPAPQRPRLVVVVLGDHLDRSERLLVELKHADGEDTELTSPLRDEARRLLVVNREFRHDAEKSGDSALTHALGHLQQVLNEVANSPAGLDPDAIERVRKQMNADGLLFEVRVLKSRIPKHAQLRVVAEGGTV